MRTLFITSLLLLVCTGLTVGAEVFTTTGNDGEKVYTDKPARNAQKIRLDVPSAASGGNDLAQDDEKSLSEMTPCERASFIVAKYTAAEMLANKDEDGNTRILDEDEKNATIERARAEEKRLCAEQDDNDA